jgi:transposase
VDCAKCEELRRRMAGMRSRNQHLIRQLKKEGALRARAEQRVAELERELLRQRRATPATTTASNSSLPPSANPIGAKPPVVKRPTGRRPGGQIGHAGKTRTLLPDAQVDQFIEHRPQVCRDCQQAIAGDAPGEVVGRHQVAELPPVAVVITEHRALACRCAHCGGLSRGSIPPDVQASVTGPRLCAAIGLLGASMKGSKRAIAMVLQEVLGCPTFALGSVSARERELSDVLAGPYQTLVASAAQSKVKYVDETGWKLRGKSRWLFVSADHEQVIFRIDKARTRLAFAALYGGGIGIGGIGIGGRRSKSPSVEPRPPRGVFCTDRAGIYDMLSIRHRQLCWAHLRRDFVAAIERGGAGEAAATRMLAVANEMFALWHRFKKTREITRSALRAGIAPLRQRMRDALADGSACGQRKTAGLCRALLKREAALWRFAATPGLEPTNNLAERMLRGAVIWRKKSFGSASQAGCRYVERMLSVTETLRLRDHAPLAYLASAVAAYRKGEATPAIEPKLKPIETKLRKVA